MEDIAEREKWKLEDVRVSNLDSESAKYGTLQRYEIRLRFGKTALVFKLWDEVSSWEKIREGGDFEAFANEFSSKGVLDVLKIEGPFELRVGGDDHLSLMLPQLNTSHAGLKRILVGEGITIEVRGAKKVSLFYTSDLGIQANRSFTMNWETSDFWSFGHSLCLPLLPVNILGSASVVAYRNQSPDAEIEFAFPSNETIELLPEKCHVRHTYKKRRCPIKSLRSRITMIERLLRSFLGDRIRKKAVLGFVKAKIEAFTVFRFQLELERDIRENDTLITTLADWKTRPSVQHVRFDVVATIEMKGLKPLMIKKVRPFIGVDSSDWSNLMSNISFTKFPSILVPPESLTLDVKW